jgi:hypothetical protein
MNFFLASHQISQGIEIPRFEEYNGKGDPTNHLNTYTNLCSDFVFNEQLLAKIFPRTLKNSALEWFSSLPNNSIHSFNELVEAFIKKFQVHMTPKLTLADLMRCKKKIHENYQPFRK